jgi:hypothetical protein
MEALLLLLLLLMLLRQFVFAKNSTYAPHPLHALQFIRCGSELSTSSGSFLMHRDVALTMPASVYNTGKCSSRHDYDEVNNSTTCRTDNLRHHLTSCGDFTVRIRDRVVCLH